MLTGGSLSAEAFLPLLLRFVFSFAVRREATALAGSAVRSALTRTVVSGTTRKTVQVVSTRQLGISIAGISYLSAPAAEAVEKYNCNAVVIQGKNDTSFIESISVIQKSINLQLNIINVHLSKIEHEKGIYIAPGEFRYSIDFPRSLPLGVKRLEAKALKSEIEPFYSGNILLAGEHDVFSS